MPRRRAGTLLPIEVAILDIAVAGLRSGEPEFYGFALAERLESHSEASGLLGHGTLYKALARLERARLLESRWEDIDASVEGRPRRRLYRATSAAAGALAVAAQAGEAGARLAPS